MHAEELLQRGSIENAIAMLQHAIDVSRSAYDYMGEGQAELLLWHAYRRTGAIGDEHARLTRLHGQRAEQAFRRARDWSKVERALTCQLTVFAELQDKRNVDYTLFKLEKLDAPRGRSSTTSSRVEWWRIQNAAPTVHSCCSHSGSAR
jgi:hypothetical protein